MPALFTFLFLLCSVFVPQNPAQPEGDETQIIAFENLWNQMQMAHDANAMEQMLDSDFVLTDYDGSVLNKAQFLASIRDKSNQLTTEVSQDMKLHRHGDTVVVIGATHEKGTLKGKPLRTPWPLHRHLDQARLSLAVHSQPAGARPQIALRKTRKGR